MAVQPVVIRYPNIHMDMSWVEPLGPPVHMVALRMLLQARSLFRMQNRIHTFPPPR